MTAKQDHASPTRETLKADPKPPCVPNRFREPLFHTVDSAMPEDWLAAAGQWLFSKRDKFTRGGDDQGLVRFNYEWCDLDKNPDATDLLAPLKKKIIAQIGDKAVLDKLAVPEFDLRYLEMHATMHHHGSHFTWHDDAPGYDQEIVPSRRVTFCYYMHSDPKMFEGGELEFLDGTQVAPQNNRLVLFHPVQQHKVNKVNCWSSHFLHGRWCIMGWIHGDPPEGWLERLPELRGTPHQG